MLFSLKIRIFEETPEDKILNVQIREVLSK